MSSNPDKASAMHRRGNQARTADPVKREKKNTQAREWARANKHKAFERSCLTKFGLTLADYDSMLAAQGGGCACCGRRINKSGRRLGVDHNHETGVVRGILCHHCNAGIGHFADDPDLLRLAIDYLERTQQPPMRAVPAIRINLLQEANKSWPSNVALV